MSFDRRYELIQQQGLDLRQDPLMEIQSGVEILRNMTIHKSDGYEVDFSGVCQKLSRRLGRAQPGQVFMEAAIAASGAAKGGLLAGILRVLEYNPLLAGYLAQRNLGLEILSSPFSLWAEAAKLPGVDLVPSNLQ